MVAATERLLHEKAPRLPNLEAPQVDTQPVAEPPTEQAKSTKDCLSAPNLNTAA
jgi:hypothetical protein